jgi:hypothetical protein
VFAFQSLHSCQLICTHRVFPLFRSTRCLLIRATDLFHGFCSMAVFWRGQPITNQMGFEVPFFNRRAA